MGLNNINLFDDEIEDKPVEEPDTPPEQTQPSGTNFNEIYKLFLISLQDYELKRLFNDSPEAADDPCPGKAAYRGPPSVGRGNVPS